MKNALSLLLFGCFPAACVIIGMMIAFTFDPTVEEFKKIRENITQPKIGCQMKCCNCKKEIY